MLSPGLCYPIHKMGHLVPESAVTPVAWEYGALASLFLPTCCRFNQSFQIWSGGLRPKGLYPCLAANTCWIPAPRRQL